jgi:transposase InsO family protein
MLTMIDEFTRECLAIDVSRRLTSEDVLERLSDLFIHRGPSEYIRSDNDPEFTAHRVQDWLENVGVKTLFIEPDCPWENGFIESFHGKLRDELLNMELFDTLLCEGTDRTLETSLQHRAATQLSRLQTTRARSSPDKANYHLKPGFIHGGRP